jgi:hypothetical protein
MIVARRFIAGVRDPMGRLNSGRGRVEISTFKRPSGTQIIFIANPAINRRISRQSKKTLAPSDGEGNPDE